MTCAASLSTTPRRFSRLVPASISTASAIFVLRRSSHFFRGIAVRLASSARKASVRTVRGPAVPFLLEPLQALAIYETDGTPALDFPAALRARGRARMQALGLRGRPMVVHPGSGSPTKNWPAERFVEIMRRLQAAGRETVAVLGEADVAEAAVLARELPEMPVLAGLTLTELAATLAECGAFLGNDSGIAHLAAAVGLPTTALFGPSDADVWAPRGRGGVTVLRAPEKELERLTVAAVWAALAQA